MDLSSSTFLGCFWYHNNIFVQLWLWITQCDFLHLPPPNQNFSKSFRISLVVGFCMLASLKLSTLKVMKLVHNPPSWYCLYLSPELLLWTIYFRSDDSLEDDKWMTPDILAPDSAMLSRKKSFQQKWFVAHSTFSIGPIFNLINNFWFWDAQGPLCGTFLDSLWLVVTLSVSVHHCVPTCVFMSCVICMTLCNTVWLSVTLCNSV